MSISLINTDFISTKIYFLRGEKVLLDADLAQLYKVEVKRLKEMVRRNITRFPDDFMFELSDIEWSTLRTQIASLELGRGKYSKYPPFAFTEQGVSGCNQTRNSLLKSNNWKVNTMNNSKLSLMPFVN